MSLLSTSATWGDGIHTIASVMSVRSGHGYRQSYAQVAIVAFPTSLLAATDNALKGESTLCATEASVVGPLASLRTGSKVGQGADRLGADLV